MNSTIKSPEAREKSLRAKKTIGASALSCAVLLGVLSVSVAPSAFAAEPAVGLGAAGAYSVLGGQTVTNTGPTVLANDLGVSPGTSITGFPPGVSLGTTHTTDANAALAQNDLTTAYNDAASRQPTSVVSGDLVGQTLVGGVYKSTSTLDLTGTLVLDGANDPSSVWVFQVGSALTTGSASDVQLINGASSCNIYWQVGSSATLGTDSMFRGSIMALSSISLTTNATIDGRALARNGAVTLDNALVLDPNCPSTAPLPTPSVTPSASASASASATATPSATTTPSASASATSTPSVTPSASASSTAPVVPVVTPPATAGNTSTPALPPSQNQIIPVDGTTPSDSSATGSNAPLASTKTGELAKTGIESVGPLTGFAAVLALFGGALLFASSRASRLSRRH